MESVGVILILETPICRLVFWGKTPLVKNKPNRTVVSIGFTTVLFDNKDKKKRKTVTVPGKDFSKVIQRSQLSFVMPSKKCLRH